MTFPAAEGVRIDWADLPPHVRREIEARVGSPVVRADTQRGGFSPALAARLRTAAGKRLFVKAVCIDANPDSPGIYRREARIAAQLPTTVPAPTLSSSSARGRLPRRGARWCTSTSARTTS
jgi:hypothetical protein